jgi:hypothetical protein
MLGGQGVPLSETQGQDENQARWNVDRRKSREPEQSERNRWDIG